MKEFCPLISDLFYFFPNTYDRFLISDQSFQKPKGGPLDLKKKKIFMFDTSKEPPWKMWIDSEIRIKDIDFCESYRLKSTKK